MEEGKDTVEKAKLSLFRRILRILTYIILGIIGLNVLVYLLLCIPFVQNKVVDFAIDQIKPIINTEVKIDRVQLSLFNKVLLEGVYVEDQARDTLIYVKSAKVQLIPLLIFKNELRFNRIELDDFVANVSQQHPDSAFNFQFIIDAFASEEETPPSDNPLNLVFSNIQLKKGRLNYNIYSEALTPDTFNVSHIRIADLNASLRLNSINMKKLDATIDALKFKEHSGLVVEDLQLRARSKGDSIYWDKALIVLPKSQLNLSGGYYNLDTERFYISTNESKIAPLDVAPFMRDLHHLKHDISLKAIVSGKLPTVRLDSLLITYGDEMLLDGKAFISDYNKYDKADLLLNIKQLKLTPQAIADFAMLGDSTFILPDIVKSLGDVRLVADLSGRLNGLKLKADMWVNQGAFSLDANASTDTTFQKFDFAGDLYTQNFNLGSLLENPDLGRVSATMNLKAKQSNADNLSAQVMGKVQEIHYQDQVIRDILLSAHYDPKNMGGAVDVNLPIGILNAKVDMISSRIPEYKIDLNLSDLQVDKFYKNPEWKNPLLSLHLNGGLKGSGINDLEGSVCLDELKFTRDGYKFEPGRIELQSGVVDNGRFIGLTSSLLDFTLSGKYDFVNLSDEVGNILHEYLPSIFDKVRMKRKNANNFTVSAEIKNTENLSKTFDLPFTVTNSIQVDGFVNTIDNRFDLTADASHLKFGDINIQGTSFYLTNKDNLFDLGASSKLMSRTAGYLGLNLDLQIESDTINSLLMVKSDSTEIKIDADFHALASFEKDKKKALTSFIKILPSDVIIGKLKLNLLPAEIKNKGSRFDISNLGFALKDKPYFGIDGVISDNKTDSLSVYFNQAQLGEIFKAFEVNNVEAIADGNVVLTNLLGKTELYTRGMNLKDIVIFQDTLGSLNLRSHWSPEEEAIRLSMKLEHDNMTSTVRGLVFPTKDSLMMKINIEKFPLSWTQPFFADMLNKLSGSVSSELLVKGKISSPEVSGWLGANDLAVGVDYTNVTYHITDTIKITPDRVGFEDLTIRDEFGNKGWANATVTHKGFKNMEYAIDMYLENLLVLNTVSRTDSLFYGKVFATGGVNIKGNDDKIDIKMDVRNNKGSFVNVLIPQTSEASEYKSIVYINTPKAEGDTIEVDPIVESVLPLNLGVELTVTPEISLGVILDPLTGDAMQMKGTGLINFTYDMAKDNMKTFGEYILSEGSVKLKLQKISTMEFKIREGSKLRFAGDPLKTSFDIVAYKRVRADVSTLDESFKTSGLSSSRVLVDCVLGIKGNLDKMDLTYNISLPEASDDVQQKVKSLISTDEQKIKQFAYLVAMGSFFPTSGANVGGGLWTSLASSTLSGGLDAVFGNMLGDKWQIGTDISSKEGDFSDMDMRVNVSTKLLDDRLKLNTNLGYRSDQSSVSDNSFIGDFDVEYELTRTLKLKAFSHTNDQIYRQASTTQGVGVVYTKEAKTLKELFRFFSKKNK